MAHEQNIIRRGRLPTITIGEIRVLEDSQEILPHHSDVVGEVRQTYAKTNIHMGRNHAKT